MARFKKGESGNPTGRPSGAKNRTSEELRDALREFLNANYEGLQEAYGKLKPMEKLRIYNDFIKQVVSPPVSLERLTEDQLKQLHEYLLKLYGNDKTKAD